MHSKGHTHHQSLATCQNPIQATLTLMIVLLFLLLFLFILEQPVQAQTSVPPTATQAARMPQFATRLGHAACTQAARQSSRHRRLSVCSQQLPTDDTVVYDNGPINGNTDAWTINFGFIVSDSFIVSLDGSTITGMTFGMWLFPGDTLTSGELSITSGINGGTSYFDQTVNFTQSNCSSNTFGFNVCTETTTFSGPVLNNGTYWVNLQNASVPSGDPAYWDENSGLSSAAENTLGSIPSESFTVLGEATTSTTTSDWNRCMPEQEGSFKVIHDFSDGADGALPGGVAIDNAGNLYGPAQTASGNGTIYKLAQAASGWVLSTLYNFIGGADGSNPQGVIVGKNQILYAAAQGGLQNCSSGYCGLIISLRPEPTPCLTASCYWMKGAAYSFTGSEDAYNGGSLVSDQAGNLYGVSAWGGAQQSGAVFELSPTIGGWSESILYSFSGSSSGAGPEAVTVGNDGNLYGITGRGGAYGAGVVFKLTPSDNGWTETVLYDVPGPQPPYSPLPTILRDSEGNLFGTYYYTTCCADSFSVIFELTPLNGQWIYTELYRSADNYYDMDLVVNMTLDAGGNLYGAGKASAGGCINAVFYGYIFELVRTNGGWQYTTPVNWGGTYWDPQGTLAWDTHGNLFGTTSFCGAYNSGTVWEFSP